MKCGICGAKMALVTTDLPFKIEDHEIIVVRDVPVHQCSSCPEYLLSDQVMVNIEQIIAAHARGVELEVVRYAA